MSGPAPGLMPSYFIPHGAGPCFFMDWDPPNTWTSMAAFLRAIPSELPQKPRAILLVSAHWVTPSFELTGTAQPKLIYDYRGFPPHTYQIRYDAPGSPVLAGEAAQLLQRDGLAAGTDAARGFDHGMFIPLKLMFPGADIPVVQLSIRADLDAASHIEAGRALSALRGEGVLIIGSGMSFHNMRAYGNPASTPVSEQFDAWLAAAAEAEPATRNARLAAWASAPAARQSHPPGEEEHLLPLMVAAGAATGPGRRVFSAHVLQTQVSAFRFD